MAFVEFTNIAANMLTVRYVSELSLRGERAQRLLRYLLEHGADEFSITVMALQDTQAPFADAFEDELGPYERSPTSRRTFAVGDATDLTRTVRRWTLNASSLARLLSFMDSGVFHSPTGPDGWLEDLAIYRHGELAFGLISHEQTGVLRLTRQEHAEVTALDIRSEANPPQ